MVATREAGPAKRNRGPEARMSQAGTLVSVFVASAFFFVCFMKAVEAFDQVEARR
ncbi:hypothetical protein [Geothrix campi]|uniref:hypothetical protein n=1 Tax=Geothrix campi TaxID=2966450 RepID=UPI0021482183|nr:hypothetical protein [Geothrix sp. SG10]